MTNLMTIGRFSRLCRLSIKTLRYYDEVGLLKPADIDTWTNYRYYTLEQAVIAERILLLRATDMPVEEIRLLLASHSSIEAEQIMSRHHVRLQQRLQETQDAITLLERLEQGQNKDLQYEIKLSETVPQAIASIRAEVLWSELSIQVSSLMQGLMEYLGMHNYPSTGAPVVVYHVIYEEGIVCEVGIPIAMPIAETDSIKNSSILGGLKAHTSHVGSYETLGNAYRALQAWIQAHGHDMVGPSYDIYRIGPDEAVHPNAYKTDCYWTIQ